MEDAGLGIKGAAALKNTSVQQPPFYIPGLPRCSGELLQEQRTRRQKPSGWPFVGMFTYFVAGVINAVYCLLFVKEEAN